jgi:acyl-CoA oxidase
MKRRSKDRMEAGRELPAALHPLAPLLYLVWADGVLTPAELEGLREQAAGDTPLDHEARAVLRSWLDPENPPTAGELEALRELVRQPRARQWRCRHRRG